MHWTVLLLILNQHKNENNQLSSFKPNTESSSKNFLFELRWNLFQVNHVKRYQTPEEQLKRKLIFRNTLLKIESHNERYNQGLETYKMGVNQFSDMTDEEFQKIYTGNGFLNREGVFNETTPPYPHNSMHENDIEPNWYTPKLPVKDQGFCGSCWTFATTGLLEYDYFYKRDGEVVSLSEQELLDCVLKENHGCKGGVPYYALEFVKENGINFEKDYPYKGRQKKCKIRPKKAPNLVQTVKMTPRTEKAIFEHLSYSPVIVGVYLNHKVWKDYDSGFITAEACKRKKINHAILILGVVNEGGHRVWYARNSFGKSWGIKGHLKLAMNENACEIGKSPGFYVTV